MGGAILILALFILLYFFQGKQWLLPIVIACAALLISRVIGALQDGTNTGVWVGIISEILLIAAALNLNKTAKKEITAEKIK